MSLLDMLSRSSPLLAAHPLASLLVAAAPSSCAFAGIALSSSCSTLSQSTPAFVSHLTNAMMVPVVDLEYSYLNVFRRDDPNLADGWCEGLREQYRVVGKSNLDSRAFSQATFVD